MYTVLSAGGVLKFPQLVASKVPSGAHARRETAQVCAVRMIDLMDSNGVEVGVGVTSESGVDTAVGVVAERDDSMVVTSVGVDK